MLLNGEQVSQFSGQPNVCTQSLHKYLLPTQCVTSKAVPALWCSQSGQKAHTEDVYL